MSLRLSRIGVLAAIFFPFWIPAQEPELPLPVPEPELPVPDWRSVGGVGLFPKAALTRGSESPVAGDDLAAIPPPSAGGFDGDYGAGAPLDGVPAGAGSAVAMLSLEEFDNLPELDEVPPLPEDIETSRSERKVIWHVNPRKARRQAKEEGKYFLLAFVGLKWQSLSQALNSEVFENEAFGGIAAEKLVCAYLDFSIKADDNHPVFNSFKRHCEVKGLPAIALFAPDGEHIWTKSGYNRNKGAFTYLYELRDRIANDGDRLAALEKKRRSWEANGFRTWHNTEGKAIYARLRDVTGGRVFFEDTTGKRSAAPVKALSFTDREVARRLMARANQALR